MSKINSRISGMLGNTVTVRKVRNQIVVSDRPKRQMGDLSDKQAAAMSRFLEATQYASRQIGQPDSLALYKTGITTKKISAYQVAVSDYLKAPVVHSIDTESYRGAIGDRLTVKATDDFLVTAVRVTITDNNGALIEEGDAGPDTNQITLWVYAARVANPNVAGTTIKAVAYDRPGNKGTATVKL